MEPWMIAIALKPVFTALFLGAVVAPITWLLYRAIPDGPFKVALFRVRSGPEASPRDRLSMALAVLCAYIVLAIIGVCSAGISGAPPA